jgi:acyl CoA:acetate/3-ketoacid CoA transferase
MLREKEGPLLINLGVGIPALVSAILSSEGLSNKIVTVVESGPWGGIALTGDNFGISMGAFAVSAIPDMFSNFEGGIIDVASLGFLQVDQYGNVNPSFIPEKITGPGGFSVIAQGTPNAFFAGNFLAGKTDMEYFDHKLHIKTDGDKIKFVNNVYKIFFSGKQAIKYKRNVKFFTERCVFSFGRSGFTLEEVAEGVDIDKDIFDKMEFRPQISKNIHFMPESIFDNSQLELQKIAQNKVDTIF